jgi:hypothetical protein
MGDKELAQRRFGALRKTRAGPLSGDQSATGYVYFIYAKSSLTHQGFVIFDTQVLHLLLVLNVIGIITGCGRLLDDFSIPLLLGDPSSASKAGTRIPGMRRAALPLALMTIRCLSFPERLLPLAE